MVNAYGRYGFVQGNDVSLRKMLNLIQKNSYDYINVLFHSFWCPFSRPIRLIFSVGFSLYPFILHGSMLQLKNMLSCQGMKSMSLDETSLDKLDDPSVVVKFEDVEEASYRFPWIKSPEKLHKEDKRLASATVFLILRLVYFFLPSLLRCVSTAWRSLILNTRITSLCNILLHCSIKQYRISELRNSHARE